MLLATSTMLGAAVEALRWDLCNWEPHESYVSLSLIPYLSVRFSTSIHVSSRSRTPCFPSTLDTSHPRASRCERTTARCLRSTPTRTSPDASRRVTRARSSRSRTWRRTRTRASGRSASSHSGTSARYVSTLHSSWSWHALSLYSLLPVLHCMLWPILSFEACSYHARSFQPES